MKKVVITFIVLLFTLTVSAQSDFDIAQEFMSKKGVELVPNKSSATRGTDVPYSIFNGSEGKGFCIVLNGNVIGYDTENTVNADDLPCCLKNMLNSYSKSPKTRSDYTPDWWKPRNVTPIEPLLTTHWSQSSPYNDLLEKKSGICTLIAWTQILHYFRVPQTYADITTENEKQFPIATFNHNLMLDKYQNGECNDEEKYEVANFVYYFKNINSYGFEVCYGMELLTIWANKDNHYLEIDKYLEKGIPLWVAGSHKDKGHAFVIDGRDSEGRYHANFGWGGYGDGYYALSDCDEHDRTYDGDDSIEGYINACSNQFYVIIPKLFNWSYTSDISNPINCANNNIYNVYNLQGIKMGNSLDGLPKGIYIQNGKKIIKN